MTSFRQMLLVSASSLALIYQLALPSAYGQAASGPAFPVTDREGPFDYSEGLIAADPTDASRLLVCTMRNGSEEGTRIEARRSIDSGVSWQRVFVSPQRSADPACAWGRNGNGYLLTLSAPDSRHHQVYRSDDGGHSWSAAGLLTGQFDRPSIVTDILSGRFQDRIYISGASIIQFSPTMVTGLSLYRSLDGGRTFLGPLQLIAPSGQAFQPGNALVTLDGVWFGTYAESLPTTDGPAVDRLPGGAMANTRVRVVSSRDGGETFDQPQTVSDFVVVRRSGYVSGDAKQMATYGPQIAADSSRGQFTGRLYIMWVDAWQGLRFSYSADKGRTWSPAITLAKSVSNDASVSVDRPSQPMVAVNRDGVVLVAWYDRSESEGSLSYRISFRVSYNGGETFYAASQIPNAGATFNGQEKKVPLAYAATSSASGGAGHTIQFEIYNSRIHLYTGGDYHYISADALGRFHLYWIDSRQSLPQVWTATVIPNSHSLDAASGLLSTLSDITDLVTVVGTRAEYDDKTGRASLSLTIRNKSDRDIKGPLILRLITVESDFGVPKVTGPNGISEADSSIVDLSSGLPATGILSPGQDTKPIGLSFLVPVDKKSRQRVSRFQGNLLKGTARLYGNVAK